MKRELTNAVKAVQSGKNENFALLYEEFKQPVYFRVVNIVGENADVEDLIQEIFITAFQKIRDLINPEKFPSWLNKIADNKCIDNIWKQQSDGEHEHADVEFVEETSGGTFPIDKL